MQPHEQYSSLVELLREQGHSEADINKILDRVREYDSQTNVDSIMDSIEDGSFNIAKIVREALGEE